MEEEIIRLKRKILELEEATQFFDIEFEKHKLRTCLAEIQRLGRSIEADLITTNSPELKQGIKHLKNFIAVIENSEEYKTEVQK